MLTLRPSWKKFKACRHDMPGGASGKMLNLRAEKVVSRSFRRRSRAN